MSCVGGSAGYALFPDQYPDGTMDLRTGFLPVPCDMRRPLMHSLHPALGGHRAG